RRGDLTGDLKAMNKAWPHKMVPNEFYEMHMRERLQSSGGVLLFSDDVATIAHYRKAFPELKILTDIIDASDLTEAQRDLVEMYAMGRCATIVAPERSAFSSTAADLFGATKLSVTEALGATLMDEAHAALMARLETDPDSFDGDGDIGQSLAHIGNWLDGHERWEDAARVFGGQVRRGVNISFVYPRALSYLHRTGDVDGVLEIAGLMADRHIVHTKDFVDSEILHGWAHIRSGDRDTGLRHIANGFWHGATGGLSRSVVPMTVELGWFDHTNFLPVSILQRAIQRRRGPAKSLQGDLPGLDELPGIELPESMGRLETMVWDWAPLLRSVSPAAAARSGSVARTLAALDKVTTGPELAAELTSQIAVLKAFSGEADEAIATLTDLARDVPKHWLIWQRLSHVHWQERKIAPALEAAERALEILPDAPAMQAWTGMIQSRARQHEQATENLRLADESNTGLSGITALYARALHTSGESDAALKTIRRARVLAPREADLAIFEAELLERSDALSEAAEVLSELVEWQRAPGKAFLQLVSILQRMGDRAQAAAMAGIGAQRFPKQPRIVALGEELAA
ncbi:MAG: hypothetical protein AAF479_15000, partial [Pseudomonadota bacterium]